MTRNATLDALKVVLAATIVGLHGHVLLDVAPGTSHFLENYLFRLAVPVFFIINGYYFFQMLERRGSWATWGSRIAIFYLTWSLVYSYYIWQQAKGPLGLLSTMVVGYWHLWYLPATLLAGGVVYLLRRWSTPWLLAAIALAYLAGLCVQYAGNYHLFEGTRLDALLQKDSVHRNFAFFGFPMFAIGFLLARTQLEQRVSRGTLVLALALGLAGVVAEYLVNEQLGLAPTQSIDLLVGLPLACTAMFLLAVQARTHSSSARLTELSAVIFFVHPLFLKNLPRAGLDSPTMVVLASLACCLLVAPLVIRLNQRWRVFI